MTYIHATVTHLRDRALTERAVDDLESLLRQLAFHHDSQAKPNSTPCRKKYHAELAARIRVHLNGEIR